MPKDYAGRRRQNGNGGRGGKGRNGGGAGRGAQRKRQSQASRRPATRRGTGIPGWVWLFCGVTVGLLAAMGAYIVTRPVGRHMSTVQQTLPAVSQPKQPAAGGQGLPQPSKPSRQSKPRFAFYNMLPNYEVVIPQNQYRSPSQKAHPQVEQSGTYVIQVASFKDMKSADAEKARLALLGIESKIQKATADNGATWYRVRVGPSQNTKKLNRVLSLLQQNHVDSLVMRVRQSG